MATAAVANSSPPSLLLPSYLNETLIRVALECGLEYPKRSTVTIDQYRIRNATAAGDNYLSDVFRVWVRFRRGHCDATTTSEDVSLIVKCMPDTGFRGPMIGLLNAYDKEVNMFRNVVPKLSALAGGEMFAARIYYATTDPVRMIIFQDLNTLGFAMVDRTTGGLDYDHCSMIMRKVAKLHAASMLLISRSSESERAKLQKQFQYGFVNPHVPMESNAMLAILAKGLDALIYHAENHWTGFRPDIVAKLKRMQPSYKEQLTSRLNQSFNDGFKVINHGDLWSNNILFKQGASGKPEDVVFVDYQLSCYTSPGVDLNYLLINCPNYEVRETQKDDLIKVYYETLKKALERAGFKNVPTLTDVYKEIKRMNFFGLVAAVSILPIVTMDRMTDIDVSLEALQDETKADQLRLLQYTGTRYRRAMGKLLEQFDQEGVLD